MIKTKKTYKYLLICGDVHDKIDIIPNFLRDNELESCAIFQVGDYGIGFDQHHKEIKKLEYTNNRLKNTNSDLFIIRGNHDKPSYYDGTYMLSNLYLLKDYSIVNINGWNVLGIGGATSVDRIERKGYWDNKTNDYWKDEIINYDENILNNIKDIDIVCTHSAPSFCQPYTKGNIDSLLIYDNELKNDLEIERQTLTNIYNKLSLHNKISHWYYGHFHFNDISIYNNTKFEALGINKIVENKLIYNE